MTRYENEIWTDGFWWGVCTVSVLVLIAWTAFEFAI
jgi:hypothetical protein